MKVIFGLILLFLALNDLIGQTGGHAICPNQCLSSPLRGIACEYDNLLVLKCPFGQQIKIVSANYGRTDTNICNGSPHCDTGSSFTFANTTCYSDQSYYFNTQCNGKNMCYATASNSVFGDPCPGTFKYLDVQYQCVLSVKPNPIPSRSILCNGDSLSVTCPKNQVINVVSVNYGRTDSSVCIDNRDGYCGVNKWFENTACYSDVTVYYKNKCNLQQTCSDSQFTWKNYDPCVGTYKYIEFLYTCEYYY